jgi:hypothetical protein
MNRESESERARAFEARPLARILTGDRALMELYKAAAQRELVRPEQAQGRNYVIVSDAAVLDKIAAAAPQLRSYAVDPKTQKIQL